MKIKEKIVLEYWSDDPDSFDICLGEMSHEN